MRAMLRRAGWRGNAAGAGSDFRQVEVMTAGNGRRAARAARCPRSPGDAAMRYHDYVLIHVVAGTIALLGFWTAAFLRKGSPRHRLVGRAYLLAMVAVIASGIPLTLQRLADGHTVTGTFLGYLLLITATGVWTAWRAIRDRHDPLAYTGPAYRALAVANLLAGAGVLALGIRVGAPLLMGFSAIGLFAGQDMLRKRARIAGRPLWWREEHYTAMLGNGVATHIAFLSLGLPRLLPGIDGTALHYAAWFGPLLVAAVAKGLLDRRHRAPVRAPRNVALPDAVRVEAR
jgi:hypothetical protein